MLMSSTCTSQYRLIRTDADSCSESSRGHIMLNQARQDPPPHHTVMYCVIIHSCPLVLAAPTSHDTTNRPIQEACSCHPPTLLPASKTASAHHCLITTSSLKHCSRAAGVLSPIRCDAATEPATCAAQAMHQSMAYRTINGNHHNSSHEV